NHSATGNKSGNSWENAIPELADALRWAREQWGENGSGAAWDAENPLQIWVAAGTYMPLYSAEDGKYRAAGENPRDNAFVMVPHVQLYGGFDGEEEVLGARDWNTNETILSGEIGGEGNDIYNAYHVVIGVGNADNSYVMDEHTVLDGFTITGGNADVTGVIKVNEQSVPRNSGGGIAVISASPTLRNLIITGNKTTGSGGGISTQYAACVLTNVVIHGNKGSSNSGGFFAYTSPGTAVPVVLTNVTISGNQGGGMSTSGTPAPIIQNSIISGNYGDTNFFGEIDEVNSGHNIIAGLEGHLPEANPLFANPISGDYRPVTGSPAIDAGSNQAY